MLTPQITRAERKPNRSALRVSSTFRSGRKSEGRVAA
jgi:hypothetical protein